MKKLIFSIFILITCVSAAQDSLFVLATKAIDEERWFDAEHLLIKGLKQGGDSLTYSYELAWTYYCNKEYIKAIKVLTPFYNKDSAPSEIYQLLGNAYDEYGNKYKATDIYKAGLNKYPKAGNLYLELGNIEFKDGNFKNALYWYEKGIEADPLFSSNYFRAAKVFLMSTEMVWGVLYGEIFMLLEPETERSKEMSKELLDAYFFCIKEDKGKAVVDFNNNIIVYSDSYERKNLLPKTFNEIMQQCCNRLSRLDLRTLIDIRRNFILKIYEQAPDFDNVLFAYEKDLISKGLFDAHCYHLFAYGEPKTTKQWISSNSAQWERYTKWIKSHPIPISTSNYFCRYNME
ncbi:MAG: hypothetical protein MJZ71_03875 [Bacteroidales bacterium]|nr:hypothetical protein [Bacteroidales bacterium]